MERVVALRLKSCIVALIVEWSVRDVGIGISSRWNFGLMLWDREYNYDV